MFLVLPLFTGSGLKERTGDGCACAERISAGGRGRRDVTSRPADGHKVKLLHLLTQRALGDPSSVIITQSRSIIPAKNNRVIVTCTVTIAKCLQKCCDYRNAEINASLGVADRQLCYYFICLILRMGLAALHAFLYALYVYLCIGFILIFMFYISILYSYFRVRPALSFAFNPSPNGSDRNRTCLDTMV